MHEAEMVSAAATSRIEGAVNDAERGDPLDLDAEALRASCAQFAFGLVDAELDAHHAQPM